MTPPRGCGAGHDMTGSDLRALSGRQPWLQVADVLGITARTVRRLRWRYQHYGYDGLFDRRRRRPSPRCAPVDESSGSSAE
jgi:hypothetical protein